MLPSIETHLIASKNNIKFTISSEIRPRSSKIHITKSKVHIDKNDNTIDNKNSKSITFPTKRRSSKTFSSKSNCIKVIKFNLIC